MVSLHHNGLNGILADEMVNVPPKFRHFRMNPLSIPGPGQDFANYLIPGLPEALSGHQRTPSYCRAQVHSAELGTRI
jgi:hypothetical protein